MTWPDTHGTRPRLDRPGLTRALSSGHVRLTPTGRKGPLALAGVSFGTRAAEPQAPCHGPLAADLGSAEHKGLLSFQKALLSLQRRMAHSEPPEQLCGGSGWGGGGGEHWTGERRGGLGLCSAV